MPHMYVYPLAAIKNQNSWITEDSRCQGNLFTVLHTSIMQNK